MRLDASTAWIVGNRRFMGPAKSVRAGTTRATRAIRFWADVETFRAQVVRPGSKLEIACMIIPAIHVERAYLLSTDGSTSLMDAVLAKDEDKELQTLLRNNFDLLPGDQIDPESPCRWMLVKREMPVPDPYSGGDRWSIDFFFVDQNATPTFVECKRYADTRSRREVIGQMLEYAANGQHYWSGGGIRKHAEDTARSQGATLDECLQKLRSNIAGSADDFFREVDRRLRAGEIRLIFFLDRAPDELKRLVEFLNKQMSLSEVLLVEARQYSLNGTRVIVPKLFGFNEQARAIRQINTAEGERGPVATDWDGFAANAVTKGLAVNTIEQLKLLYETCKELRADISWGRGSVTASFSPKWRSIETRAAPFSVYATGALELHLSSLRSSERAIVFSDRFAASLSSIIPLRTDHMTNWYAYPVAEWLPQVERIIAALSAALPNAEMSATASAG